MLTKQETKVIANANNGTVRPGPIAMGLKARGLLKPAGNSGELTITTKGREAYKEALRSSGYNLGAFLVELREWIDL